MAKKIEKAQHSKAPASTGTTHKASTSSHVSEKEFPFTSENYKLFGIGFGLIILGFILMSGSEDIMSFRKIHLSSMVLMAGYLFNIYAIMKRPSAPKAE